MYYLGPMSVIYRRPGLPWLTDVSVPRKGKICFYIYLDGRDIFMSSMQCVEWYNIACSVDPNKKYAPKHLCLLSLLHYVQYSVCVCVCGSPGQGPWFLAELPPSENRAVWCWFQPCALRQAGIEPSTHILPTNPMVQLSAPKALDTVLFPLHCSPF
jgi:hypothetical protein